MSMLLTPGRWQGKGSLVLLGSNTGTPFSCQLESTTDELGRSVNGTIAIEAQDERTLSVRVAEDDTGLYQMDLRLDGFAMDGSAKLESTPNMGMLWNEAGSVHASFAFFPINRGCGCRGFLKTPDNSLTWEVALEPVVEKLSGGNVVSMRRRR